MSNLKQIKVSELKDCLPAQDFSVVTKSREQVFCIPVSKVPEKTNPLVEVEVSLRRCERVGFFEMDNKK